MSHHTPVSLRARRPVAATLCTLLVAIGLTTATGAAAHAEPIYDDGALAVTWEAPAYRSDNGLAGIPDVGDVVRLAAAFSAGPQDIIIDRIVFDGTTFNPGRTIVAGDSFTYSADLDVRTRHLGLLNTGPDFGSLEVTYTVDGATSTVTMSGPPLMYTAAPALGVSTTYRISSGTAPVAEGDTIAFETVFTNTSMRALRINRAWGYDALTGPIDLGVGASVTLKHSATAVTNANVVDGVVNIDDAKIEWVAGAYSGEFPVTFNSVPTVPLDASADVAITLTARGQANGNNLALGEAKAGDLVDWALLITNTGNITMDYFYFRLDNTWARSELDVQATSMRVAPGTSTDTDPGSGRVLDSSADATDGFTPYVLTSADITRGYVDLPIKFTTAPTHEAFIANIGTLTQTVVTRVLLRAFTTDAALIATATLNDSNGDGIGQAGETVDYHAVFSNHADQALSISGVTDSGDLDTAGQAAACFTGVTVATGATFPCDWTYTISAEDEDNLSLTYGLTVSYTGGIDSATASRTASTSTLTTGVYIEPIVSSEISATHVVNSKYDSSERPLGDAVAGDRINYTIGLTNTGNVGLGMVCLGVVWHADTINWCSSPNLTGVLAPGASLPYDNWTTERLTSSGGWFDPYVITDEDIARGYVDVAFGAYVARSWSDFLGSGPRAMPTVTKRVFLKAFTTAASVTSTATLNDTNGDGIGQAGETVDYHAVFTNHADQALSISGVTDSGDLDTTGQAAACFTGVTVATGATFPCDWTYTISAEDEDNLSLTYGLTVSYTGGIDSATASRTASTPTLTTGVYIEPIVSADSWITTSVNTSAGAPVALGDAVAGDVVDFTFHLTNTGNVTLDYVLLGVGAWSPGTVSIEGDPSGLTPGASLPHGIWQDSYVTSAGGFWNAYAVTGADIARGYVDLDFTIKAARTYTSFVQDPAPYTHTVVERVFLKAFTTQASLDVIGTLNDLNGDGIGQAGETVNYAYALTNTSDQQLVLATLTGSDGANLLDASGRADGDTLPTGGALSGSVSHTITDAEQALGHVEYGAHARFTGAITSTKASASATSQTITTGAYVAPATTIVASATYVDVNGDTFPSIGETVTITVDVANTGAYRLTGLAVTDATGADVTGLLPGFPVSLGARGTGIDTATASFTYVLTASDFARGSLTYAAQMTADGLPDGKTSAWVSLTDLTFQAYATDLDDTPPGGIAVCDAQGNPTDTIVRLSTISVKPSSCDHKGPSEGFRVVAFSAPLVLGVDTFAVKVPAALTLGEHRLALYGPDGSVVGWQAVTVKDPIGFAGEDAGAGALAFTGSDAGMTRAGLIVAGVLVLIGFAALISPRRRRRPAGPA